MNKKVFSVFYLGLSLLIFMVTIRFFVDQKIIVQDDVFVNLESKMEEALKRYSFIKEIYGVSNKVLSPCEIVDEREVVVKDSKGFLQEITNIDYDITEAETKIKELKDVCNSNGTEFVYVSFPSKSNENTLSLNYGIETNQEEIRREFLKWLEEKEINTLNVRERMEEDGYTVHDIFYKTDHHWKCPAGLYAARSIGNYLNDTFGYSLRTDLLDENQFTYTTYDELWLGENGRKLSKTWAGTLDDFTEILPVYDTSFEISGENADSILKGDFSMMVDESGYSGDLDLYSYSAHYSYGQGIDSPTWIHNNNVEGKKILVIKDSFSLVVIPFLSLTTSDICVWDMRETKDGLYDYIANNDFDVVIVEYTDFWDSKMWEFK